MPRKKRPNHNPASGPIQPSIGSGTMVQRVWLESRDRAEMIAEAWRKTTQQDWSVPQVIEALLRKECRRLCLPEPALSPDNTEFRSPVNSPSVGLDSYHTDGEDLEWAKQYDSNND